MRIGYLIGQFPGPSHTYFWREIQTLRAQGVRGDIVSTRLPRTAMAPHGWAREAVSQTDYLFPLTAGQMMKAALHVALAGPAAWWRCAWAILRADHVTWRERATLPAYVLMGAHLAVRAREGQWTHLRVGFCGEQANLAMFARLLNGPPYSLTLHSPLHSFGGNQRGKWRHAAFGMAVSKSLLAELQQKLGDALPAQMRAVPMGVDVQACHRQRPYEPWSGLGSARIFCGARWTPRKGQLELIRAVAALRDLGLPVQLRLAGEDMGQDKWFTRRMKEVIAELHAEAWVELLGVIPEEQVRDELERAHLFVLASYEEGMSVAVMEAMAMEMPVVVTSVDGLPELVDDNVEGLMVPPGDVRALAEAIQSVLERPEAAREMGQCGRRKVVSGFSCQRLVGETLALIVADMATRRFVPVSPVGSAGSCSADTPGT